MLRQIFILLSAFMFSQYAFSQDGPDTMYLNGLDLIYAKKYDSALTFFNDLYKKSGYKYYSKALISLADIDRKLGDMVAADSLYRMCLEDTTQDSQFEKHFSALSLADIHLSEKRFREALSDLDISQTFDPGIYCGTGSFDRALELNRKYSNCLEGLGYLDSAINRLTTLVFAGSQPLLLNKKKYEQTSRYYYSLLLKRYGSCQLQEMLHEMIIQLQYVKLNDTSFCLNTKMYRRYKIECKSFFAEKTVWLLNAGLESFDSREPLDPYSKEYCLCNFENSILYKMIMAPYRVSTNCD